jgi:uncharacterized membrane protein YheB (UPF0754 family)
VLLGLPLEDPARGYVLNTGLYALSGGVTNWLAIHMLFERVPGLYGSGVIPLRFEEFKLGIRTLIMEQFFNKADLDSFLHGAADVSGKMAERIKQEIDDLDLAGAFESLLDVIMSSSFAGMLGMIGGRDALRSLQQPFIDRMRAYFQTQFDDSAFQEQVRNTLNAALDDEVIRGRLEQLIDQRLNEMTPQMVKEIIQQMIHKHLGWLVVWGCAFGGLIGLVVKLVGAL